MVSELECLRKAANMLSIDVAEKVVKDFQRKITLQNLLFPLKFISSLLKSRSIIKRFKPDAVIGTGGFASGAVVKVAFGTPPEVAVPTPTKACGIMDVCPPRPPCCSVGGGKRGVLFIQKLRSSLW